MRISDWSSDVCSSDLDVEDLTGGEQLLAAERSWEAGGVELDNSAAGKKPVGAAFGPGGVDGKRLAMVVEIGEGDEYIGAGEQGVSGAHPGLGVRALVVDDSVDEIGRASRREGLWQYVTIAAEAVAIK